MSLQARVGLLAFVAVILGVGLTVGGSYFLTQRELRQEVDDFLERRAEVVAGTLGNPADAGARGELGTLPVIGVIELADFDAHVQILDGEGQPVFSIGAVVLPVGSEERRLATGGDAPVRRTAEIDGQRYRILTAPFSGEGAVQIARNLDETDRVLNDLLRRTVPLGAAIAVAAATAAWLLTRRALRPVAQLTDATERVARTQDLAAAIEVNRGDEVGVLARSFNAMLEALRTSRQQQKRLVADAGHELRTPLTSIRTNVDLLQRVESLQEGERRRILTDVNAELHELSELVRELVELAGEPGADDEPFATLDLADLAVEAADRARRRTGREIATEASDREPVSGQLGSLERAIDNLVGNATKFTPEGTPIRILTAGGRLEVHDAGPGIPIEDQPLVFDRFFRSASARAKPGSGLGLAIVKQIIERLDGHVWAGKSPMGGAEVGFEIPTGKADDH
ncbi:MAG: HAMP domain-containing histidine kinase [Gammaproteobacteria bacterium]|nr:HAMP domain-containing histidine kinase [Gammaproteobacteria bacterium]